MSTAAATAAGLTIRPRIPEAPAPTVPVRPAPPTPTVTDAAVTSVARSRFELSQAITGSRPRHHVLRGTRILAFIALGLAGLTTAAIGGLGSEIVAGALGRGAVLPSAVEAPAYLLLAAPFLGLYGVGQLLSAWAVLRDKPRAITLGLGSAVLGILVSAVAVAGLAVTGPIPTSLAGDLLAVAGWVLAMHAAAFLLLRRIRMERAAF